MNKRNKTTGHFIVRLDPFINWIKRESTREAAYCLLIGALVGSWFLYAKIH